MRRMMMATSAMLLVGAAAPVRLHPGLWAISSSPGTATLDGRKLDDLPYTPSPGPDTICLDPTAAGDPAAWFARDLAAGCTYARRSIAGGRIAIAGTCPPQAAGLARGTVKLDGSWSADAYQLTFATENPGENGRMGFTGSISGHRVGDCPAG